jgi:hypothetical protein
MMYQGAIVATMDWLYPLSGFVVGAIVGLTGMGGGSLMTPLLSLSELIVLSRGDELESGAHCRCG